MALSTRAIHAAHIERRWQFLEREHDKRVEEYRALEKMLPRGLEIAAIRVAVTALKESEQTYVASVLAAYVERLKKFDR